MIKKYALRYCTLLTLTILLYACGSTVNSANFEKVQTDMSEAAVTRILGEPTESNSMEFGPFSGTQSTWKSKDSTITIQFVNGKVKAKQFSKGTP